MPQEATIRTNASIMGSALVADNVAVVQPLQYARISPHAVESIAIQPSSGAVQPGNTAVFKVRRQGDHVLRVKLCATARTLSGLAGVAGSTFIRYPDRAALCFVREVRIRYNSQRLQTLRPSEILLHTELYMNDEEKEAANYMMLGGMTDFQRNMEASQDQNWQLPLYTSFMMHDPSNAPFVDGLANEIEIEFDFDTRANFIQTDGTVTLSSVPADSATGPSWFSNAYLQVDYLHVTERRRQEMVKLYSSPQGVRHIFNEFQYYSDVIPAATSIAGVYTSQIRGNINQPVHTLFVLLRWASDLTRSAGASGGERGKDIANFGGWFQPGGAGATGQYKLFTRCGIKSGNIVVCEDLPVEEYLVSERSRYFKG